MTPGKSERESRGGGPECRLHRGAAPAFGVAGGLVLYLVNFYGFTAVFPWFAMARTPITIFTHIVFGWSRLGAIWPW